MRHVDRYPSLTGMGGTYVRPEAARVDETDPAWDIIARKCTPWGDDNGYVYTTPPHDDGECIAYGPASHGQTFPPTRNAASASVHAMWGRPGGESRERTSDG